MQININRFNAMKKSVLFFLLLTVLSFCVVCCTTNDPSNPQEQTNNSSDNTGGNSGESSGTDLSEKITVFVVTWRYMSGVYDEYSSETRNDLYAVRSRLNDKIYLSKDGTLNRTIATLSSNMDSKCGTYDVSGFSYRALEQVDLNTTKYYYTVLSSTITGGSSGGSSGGSTGGGTATDDEDDLSTNYAPSNVTNFKFSFAAPTSTDIYFTSNTSVNSSLSGISHYPSDYTITSGSYTKTSNNKATITFQYNMSGNYLTRTYYLTFTSATSGKIMSADGLSTKYNFTCEYLGSGTSVSAPSSISYLKFTVGSTWYKFGSCNGARYEVTSSSKSSSYTLSASYTRYSNTSATLLIYSTLGGSGSYSSTTTYTYRLTFLTSTSGTYSRTSDNRFDTSTETGTFKLE